MEKIMFASDIHGSGDFASSVVTYFMYEGADRLVLLGDFLYHGPRNPLPNGYAPKEVIAMLEPIADRILAIRGNCDAEVDEWVLPFPLTDYEAVNVPCADEICGSLGDVVLSLERAKEQADEYGHSFDREIAFLVVHSMLHLLGYDHETSEEDELDMRQRQSEILKNMGLDIKN